ncbi:MAG: hypothetical protein ABI647_20165 [Gemmatimonadota bacterium]
MVRAGYQAERGRRLPLHVLETASVIPDSRLPRLSLGIEAGGVPYAVVVNDVPVWADRLGHAATIDGFPVLEWLVPGANTLEIRLGLSIEPNAISAGSVDVELRCDLDGDDSPLALTSLSLSPTTVGGAPAGRFAIEGAPGNQSLAATPTGDIVIEPIRLGSGSTSADRRVLRTIQLPWRWPRWRHFDAPTIIASGRTQASLEESYRQMWNLLRANDRARLVEFLAVKVAELVAANPKDRRHIEPILGLEDCLDDPEMALKPLTLESTRLEIAGGGSLARLVDARGNGPIVFVHRDGLMSICLDTMFCMGSSGWVLVR